jgi:hypothetical protein
MKIAVGSGAYLEPDEGPRDTRFHKRIVRVERIANTRTGLNVTLACGHGVQTFGDLAHAEGVVLCTKCRDAIVDETKAGE